MQSAVGAPHLWSVARRSAAAANAPQAARACRRAVATFRPPIPPSAPRASVKSVGETRAERVAQVDQQKQTTSSSPPPSSSSSKTSPGELLTVLEETIKTHGPLTVPRFMTLCLNHPTLGYYTTRTVFGKEGDFVTSPEISQVFGELLAIWYVTQWLAQGSPKRVRVVELGPGRGTLLADVLRTFRALPAHSRPPVSSIHLVEQSDKLKAVQKARLVDTGFGETPVEWHADVQAVPISEDEFTVLIAHEFFDALPIHVFENTQKGWREVLVDIADPKSIVAKGAKREPLRLVLAPGATPASALYTSLAQAAFPHVVQAGQLQPDLNSAAAPLRKSPLTLNVDTTRGLTPVSSASLAPEEVGRDREDTTVPGGASGGAAGSLTAQRFARLPIGSRIEVSPASWQVARDTARLVSGPAGGAGLVVDYGDAKAFGRSWRGFRKHQVVDPLTEPGHTDLTANVDFSYLAEAMSEVATTHGPVTQARFLTALGLEPRLAGLLRGASTDARRKEIESAAKRLVDPSGMGTQYKVMAVTPPPSLKKGGGVGTGVGVRGAQEEKRAEEGVFPFDLV